MKLLVVAVTLATSALAAAPVMVFCDGPDLTGNCKGAAFPEAMYYWDIPADSPTIDNGSSVKLDDPDDFFKDCELWPNYCEPLFSTPDKDNSPRQVLPNQITNIREHSNWTALCWTCTPKDNGITQRDVDNQVDVKDDAGGCIDGYKCEPDKRGYYFCYRCDEVDTSSNKLLPRIEDSQPPNVTTVLDRLNDTSAIGWCDGEDLTGKCQVSLILGNDCMNLDLDPKSAQFKIDAPEGSFSCKTFTDRNCTGKETLIKNNFQLDFIDAKLPQSFSCDVPPTSTSLTSRSARTESFLQWCTEENSTGFCEVWYLDTASSQNGCTDIPFVSKSFLAWKLGAPNEWRTCVVWEHKQCPEDKGDGQWTGDPGINMSGIWNWALDWTPGSFRCYDAGHECPSKGCGDESASMNEMVAAGELVPFTNQTSKLTMRSTADLVTAERQPELIAARRVSANERRSSIVEVSVKEPLEPRAPAQDEPTAAITDSLWCSDTGFQGVCLPFPVNSTACLPVPMSKPQSVLVNGPNLESCVMYGNKECSTVNGDVQEFTFLPFISTGWQPVAFSCTGK